MNDHALLAVGLGCFFGAIAVAVLVLRGEAVASPVARSLAALDDFTLMRSERLVETQPVGDRVLQPLFGRLRGLAVRLSPSGYTGRLQTLLDKAGNPRGWTVDRVFAYKGLALIGLGGLGALFGARSAGTLFVYGLVGAAAGFWLPDLLVYNMGIKRQEKIQKTLPDALDMLTVSVEAGLGFDAALAQVARNTEGPIAGEFFRVLQEMQIGKSRTAALRGLGERTTVADLRTFASAIVQADSLGIPIANVLRAQAKEMRLKRHQRAEEQAQKVTVKMMFPLVMCILPSLFVVIIGPGAITLIHTFSHRVTP